MRGAPGLSTPMVKVLEKQGAGGVNNIKRGVHTAEGKGLNDVPHFPYWESGVEQDPKIARVHSIAAHSTWPTAQKSYESN